MGMLMPAALEPIPGRQGIPAERRCGRKNKKMSGAACPGDYASGRVDLVANARPCPWPTIIMCPTHRVDAKQCTPPSGRLATPLGMRVWGRWGAYVQVARRARQPGRQATRRPGSLGGRSSQTLRQPEWPGGQAARRPGSQAAKLFSSARWPPHGQDCWCSCWRRPELASETGAGFGTHGV